MPIFGRRQLDRMLRELEPWLLRSNKTNDLLKRVEHVDPDTSLPAEYELALSWAVSRLASLEIDRPVGGRTPDIWSEDLFADGPVVADIAALSDDAFIGESVMIRAANIINSVCCRFIKGAENHVYYSFQEKIGYLPADRHSNGFTRFSRERCISNDFEMDASFEAALRMWLAGGAPHKTLRWTGPHIDVIMSWIKHVNPKFNTQSTIPASVYDVRTNPLRNVLRKKARQLRGAEDGVRRIIFLGDAGCSILKNLHSGSHGIHSVSGQDIIRTFLAESVVDMVVVFSPQSTHRWHSNHTGRQWQFTTFHRDGAIADDVLNKLQILAELLPPPYLFGEQARSWHQQGMCDPQARGRYLVTTFTSKGGHMTARISARSLQELIAGKISQQQFERWIVGEDNPFRRQLERGCTISSISFEPKHHEADDDYVVFEFSEDPTAASLKAPSQKTDVAEG